MFYVLRFTSIFYVFYILKIKERRYMYTYTTIYRVRRVTSLGRYRNIITYVNLQSTVISWSSFCLASSSSSRYFCERRFDL